MSEFFTTVLPSILRSPRQWSRRTHLLTALLAVVIGIWGAELLATPNRPSTDSQFSTPAGLAKLTVPELGQPTSVVHEVIKNSIYSTVVDAGLDPGLAVQLRNIFGGRVDFRRDLRPGDWFTVIYGARNHAGKAQPDDDLLAAEISIHNHIYRAFRFTGPKQHAAYYTSKGGNLQMSIWRAPLKYKRISSRFSYHRMNPILHIVRPHYGVDYAAPTGTPVSAAANGYVHFAGRAEGYGNLVIINSYGAYQTYYAHLIRFARGLHNGERVHQGQIIGYVGETGEATGPHLHFGIMVSGVWRNPLTVKLPQANPLPIKELPQFKAQVAPLVTEFNELGNAPSEVAAAEDSLNGRHTSYRIEFSEPIKSAG